MYLYYVDCQMIDGGMLLTTESHRCAEVNMLNIELNANGCVGCVCFREKKNCHLPPNSDETNKSVRYLIGCLMPELTHAATNDFFQSYSEICMLINPFESKSK